MLLKLRRTLVFSREAEITVTGQELCAEEHAKGTMTGCHPHIPGRINLVEKEVSEGGRRV